MHRPIIDAAPAGLRKAARQFLLIGVMATAFTGCAITPWETTSSSLGDTRAIPTDAQSPVAAGFYRVNPGDTLSGIANAFGRELPALARWNRMPVTVPVFAGQVLRVAPPSGESPEARDAENIDPNQTTAGATRFIWPAPGPVTANFVAGTSKGIDIGGREGDPVKAAEGGRVVYAGGRIKAYGLLIIIKHDAHFLTAYGNNRRLLVKEGATVAQGQAIAEIGSGTDGFTSLRFEVRNDSEPVDPLDYLPKRPG